MNSIRTAVMLLVAGLVAFPAIAQVAVTNAWVRGTVAGQKATGAFMELKSPADTALVAVASPSAAIVEIHEMKMDGTMMTMRAVDKIVLPAGKTVELKAGRLPRDADGSREAAEGRRFGAAQAHVRGQGRQEGDAGCERAGQSADRGRRGAGEALSLAARIAAKQQSFRVDTAGTNTVQLV